MKPNFFIIGAPKCGTTSVSNWINAHSQCYMSPYKEPKYFSRDIKTRARISKHSYKTLFAKARTDHLAIGEATVWYLYSEEAVPNIEKEVPESKYIVILRNPIEMAYSLHEQMTLNGAEHIRDFSQAWNKCKLRRQGKGKKSLFISDLRLLDYQEICSIGSQVERLFSSAPKDRILILLLDDLKKNAAREYKRILQFLGLKDDGRTDFPPSNPAKRVRSYSLQKVLTFTNKVERIIKSQFGLPPTSSQITQHLNLINKVARPRPPLSIELRKEMEAYFAHDIHKLEVLLDRDFSCWFT